MFYNNFIQIQPNQTFMEVAVEVTYLTKLMQFEKVIKITRFKNHLKI